MKLFVWFRFGIRGFCRDCFVGFVRGFAWIVFFFIVDVFGIIGFVRFYGKNFIRC